MSVLHQPGYINVVANGHVIASVPANDGTPVDPDALEHWCAVAYALDEDARSFGAEDQVSVIEVMRAEDVATIDSARAYSTDWGQS